MRFIVNTLLAAVLTSTCAPLAFAADGPGPAPTSKTVVKPDPALDAAIAGDWRSAKNTARDRYRHPRETLSFFGVRPTQTIIEITPGGGWYSEILAPYLNAKGHYIAALAKPAKPDGYDGRNNKALAEKFAADAARYGKAKTVEFDPKAPVFGAPGSADTVLTFRNVHNWIDAGTAPAYFKGFFAVLKPGGTLGVVDHRAKSGTDLQKMKDSGYLTEELVIKLATDAGFKLDAKSEVNANPKDTADHPKGVWTLPPTNQHDAADDAKYKAIGESDRMTLRFVKP